MYTPELSRIEITTVFNDNTKSTYIYELTSVSNHPPSPNKNESSESDTFSEYSTTSESDYSYEEEYPDCRRRLFSSCGDTPKFQDDNELTPTDSYSECDSQTSVSSQGDINDSHVDETPSRYTTPNTPDAPEKVAYRRSENVRSYPTRSRKQTDFFMIMPVMKKK